MRIALIYYESSTPMSVLSPLKIVMLETRLPTFIQTTSKPQQVCSFDCISVITQENIIDFTHYNAVFMKYFFLR
jgi:hypothetical protein